MSQGGPPGYRPPPGPPGTYPGHGAPPGQGQVPYGRPPAPNQATVPMGQQGGPPYGGGYPQPQQGYPQPGYPQPQQGYPQPGYPQPQQGYPQPQGPHAQPYAQPYAQPPYGMPHAQAPMIVVQNQIPYPGAMMHPDARKKDTALILAAIALFFGIFGLHKFYLRQTGMGILYLFTFGLCGIGQLIDVIQLATMSQQEFDMRYNTGR